MAGSEPPLWWKKLMQGIVLIFGTILVLMILAVILAVVGGLALEIIQWASGWSG